MDHPPGRSPAIMSAYSDAGQMRRTHRLLAGILVLGLLLRLMHFAFILPTPFPRWALVADQTDMHVFWQWAHRIIAGDWLGRDTYHPYFRWMQQMDTLDNWHARWGGKEIFHQAPLYPYALAGLLAIRNSPSFVILIQLLVGALQPLVLFFLGRRLFDARVGLLAAALSAFYGPFVFYQSVLLRDWLPPILEPLILVMVLRAMDRPRWTAWVLAGFVMGIAVLTKETALLLGIITLGWVAARYRHAGREALRSLSWVVLGSLLCFSPLVARNILVGAPPLATSVQRSWIIIVGLVPDASPGGFSVPSAQARAIVNRSRGDTVAAFRETLRAYPDGVWGLARHQLRKLRTLVDPFEIPNNVNYYYGLERSPALSLSLGYGLIFPLGAAGLVLLLKTWPRPGLFYCYLAAALGSQLMTFVLARFRLAFIPVLILAGAYFCSRLLAMVRERQIPSVVGSLGLVAAIALAQQLWVPVGSIPMTLRTAEYDYSAKVYASDGRLDLAVAEMARLRSKAGLNPAYHDLMEEASVGIGNYQVRWAAQMTETGRWQEARAHALQAQEAYQAQSRFTLWSYNLAWLYLDLNDPGKAKAFFRQFLDREPDGPRADEARAALSELGD